MPQAIPLGSRKLVGSIARLAETFDRSRQKTTKLLADAGVQPCGLQNGHPVYPLKEAAAALLGVTPTTAKTGGKSPDFEIDPRQLSLDDRRKFYEVEAKRLAYEKDARTLVESTEAEHEMAILVGGIAQFLETFADVAERDAGLTPDQLVAVEAMVAQERQRLYEQVSSREHPTAKASRS